MHPLRALAPLFALGALTVGCAGDEPPPSAATRCADWVEDVTTNPDTDAATLKLAEALSDDRCQEAADRGLVTDDGSVAPASMKLVIDCFEGGERECFRPGLADALTADQRYLGLDATTRLILLEGMLAYSNYDGWLFPNATLPSTRPGALLPGRSLSGFAAWAHETRLPVRRVERAFRAGVDVGLLQRDDDPLDLFDDGRCTANLSAEVACGHFRIDERLLDAADG